MSFDRAAALARLADEEFDVLVVGAGITGAGTAVDAAQRGLRTALIDRGDFASGTSSKSSKLVHGGIRYLQQREIGLVYEALHERRRLQHNAPHLVEMIPFMIPVLTRDGDYFIPLRDRYRVAEKVKADLFISIHANSSRRRGRGSPRFSTPRRFRPAGDDAEEIDDDQASYVRCRVDADAVRRRRR